MSTAIATTEHNPRPALQSGGAVRAIVPQDFDGAWRIASAIVAAGMAPKGLETPEKAMVAIMHGLEVGLTPMNALQSIAVINSRATLWGDGALGLVQASGKLESHKEWFEGEGDSRKALCLVKRKGDPESKLGEFSVADAKKANLWGKGGPWTQYSDRMLKMRARAFALRDGFSDVLRGLGIAEEVADITPAQAAPTPPSPPSPPPVPTIEADAPIIDEQPEAVTGEQDFDAAQFFEELEIAMAGAHDAEAIEAAWSELDVEATLTSDETNLEVANKIKARALKRLEAPADDFHGGDLPPETAEAVRNFRG